MLYSGSFVGVALRQAVSTTRLPPTRVQMGAKLCWVSPKTRGGPAFSGGTFMGPQTCLHSVWFRPEIPRKCPSTYLKLLWANAFPLFGHQVSAKTGGTPPSRPVGVMQGPRPKNTTHNGHVHEFGTSIQMGTSPDCRAFGKSPPQMDHALDVLAEPHLKQVAPVGKLAKHLTGLLPFDPTLPAEGNQSKPHFSPWVLIICERLG